MKIMAKVMLSFGILVLVFGLMVIYLNSLSVEREKTNTIKLYEERAVSIAKALDASITSEEQLNTGAQALIDKAGRNNIGIYEFSIHAKAPAGQSESGYWRVASNDPTIVHTASDPEDLDAITQDKYNVIFEEENGVRIIDVTYPLHDASGKAIATAGIKFDMSAVDSMLIPSSTYLVTILMIIAALIVGAVISYNISKPIRQLKDVADKVTDGDFSTKLPEAKSDDEISQLTASMEMLIVSLKLKSETHEHHAAKKEHKK